MDNITLEIDCGADSMSHMNDIRLFMTTVDLDNRQKTIILKDSKRASRLFKREFNMIVNHNVNVVFQ